MEDNPGDDKPASSGSKPVKKHKVTWRGIEDVDENNPASARGFMDRVMATSGRGSGGAGSDGPPPSGGTDPYGGLRRHRRKLGVIAAIIVVCGGLLISMVHIVRPGSVIVPQVLGSAKPALGEGIHLTLPWPIEKVSTMSVQTLNYTMTAAKSKGTDPAVLVLGLDGASATVDATVLYRIDKSDATEVYRNVGTNYLSQIIVPSARTCIRGAYAGVDLVRAATGEFPEIATTIRDCMKTKMEPKGITVVDFQLRDLALSKNIQSAVDLKVAADQKIVASQHQADAQRLEAQGQADAAQILACGGTLRQTKDGGKTITKVVPNPSEACKAPPIDSAMLTYNYIQALRDIINSPNSTVILPNGDSGQPIINVPATPDATKP